MRMKQRTATITRPNNATAYTAGDVIGEFGSGSLAMLFSAGQAGNGRVRGATLVDSNNQATKLDADIMIFQKAAPTVPADNAPFAPTAAQMVNAIGTISLLGTNAKTGDITAGTGNLVYNSGGVDIPFADYENRTLYAVLIARSAYTPVALETFTLTLWVEEGE
jgi:hypothetical protein